VHEHDLPAGLPGSDEKIDFVSLEEGVGDCDVGVIDADDALVRSGSAATVVECAKTFKEIGSIDEVSADNIRGDVPDNDAHPHRHLSVVRQQPR
jgi:hypothetical protein